MTEALYSTQTYAPINPNTIGDVSNPIEQSTTSTPNRTSFPVATLCLPCADRQPSALPRASGKSRLSVLVSIDRAHSPHTLRIDPHTLALSHSFQRPSDAHRGRSYSPWADRYLIGANLLLACVRDCQPPADRRPPSTMRSLEHSRG